MRRRHLTETLLVLGVSLGSSAVYALLRIVDRLTRTESLGSQTTAMNSSVTADRPWLDLAYQLVGIGLALVP
ncbi:MAG: CPBP family intramembrane glutamate endopeptidase, partial [Dermatophilaceae bacterium]